jgi:peptidyl-prolyl cis-trans isomerase D
MLQFFRNFFKSKFGVIFTLAFLALIGLAFALGDVSNTGTFGGVTGGDRVALVGDRRISTADLSENATSALERMRQQDPTMTMEAFVDQGGMDDLLDNMVSRNAIAAYGYQQGLRAGSRLVDSEIVSTPQFRAVDGTFDTEAFRAALRQQGLSESLVRDDLAMGLFARQLVFPVVRNPVMPQAIARQYARLLQERRSGWITAVQAAPFAPKDDPTAAQLQTYYEANQANYIRPERRVIRYATFGEDALKDLPAPTQAQIEERYERDKDQYTARETRSFTQLVVPTQAAAQAIVDEVKGGTSLAASARSKGLATTQVAATTKEDLASQTSAAVANAGFAAAQGAIAAPAQGSLGWYVLRVDQVTSRPGQTLAQAHDAISSALAAEQRREALNELTAHIDDEFGGGSSLSEVAEAEGLELKSSPPLTAAGQVYGTGQSAPAEIAPIVDFAFDLDEGSPQISSLVPGQTFVVFEVEDVTPSATAPLNEIRDQVTQAWRRDEGMKLAGEAAARIRERVEQGSTLAEAVAAEDVELLLPDRVDMDREEAARGGQLPPAMALFFSMAKGTVKRLESPQTQGWFVIQLNDIDAPDLAADDPLVADTAMQLSSLLEQEYSDQFVAAARDAVDVEINQVAVDAVANQITGRTQQ